jgi:hypothetical protein
MKQCIIPNNINVSINEIEAATLCRIGQANTSNVQKVPYDPGNLANYIIIDLLRLPIEMDIRILVSEFHSSSRDTTIIHSPIYMDLVQMWS